MPITTPAPVRTGSKKHSPAELNILTLIHGKPGISRVELTQACGMSTGSVSAIVQSLIDRNLVSEGQQVSSKSGRRRIALRLRSELGYVVGVDLGTFFVRIVITDIGGEVIYSTELESGMGAGREEILRRTFSAVRDAIASAPIDGRPFLGIGLGHSGVIDSQRGVVLSFPRPGQTEQWKNVPLQKMFEDEFGVPALLEDSVRTIAMSEAQYGAGTELEDYIYVYVGMGVGSAIFINGKLYRGSGGSAGEFGHITVAEDGPLCCCGNTGCLEAVASSAAIIENVKTAIKMGVATKVSEMAEGKLDRISIEMIAEARDQNDSLAFRVMSQAASHIGAACADLVNLLNPSAIVFGGGLFRGKADFFLDHLRRTIRQRSLEKLANEVTLIASALDTNAGARAAAHLIAGKLIESVYADSF